MRDSFGNIAITLNNVPISFGCVKRRWAAIWFSRSSAFSDLESMFALSEIPRRSKSTPWSVNLLIEQFNTLLANEEKSTCAVRSTSPGFSSGLIYL